ncbi:hypothetical protein AB4259_19410 [Vibrio amylolyticus]|uniref:hypothetical protein n=1 Tax=Vibrio amylolyticus TaxID=2847292 RepID=UPI00354D33D9
MIAALTLTKWTKRIKWGVFALIFAALVVMWIQLEASDAKRETAEQKLASALAANLVSQASIDTLTFDNEYINRLLIDRKRQNIKAKKVLRDEMEQLKADMANISCTIPSDVTERLQQPY